MVDIYEVVTSKQETKFIEADMVELNEQNGRLKLTLDGNIVGSFLGYSSCNIVKEVTVPGASA